MHNLAVNLEDSITPSIRKEIKRLKHSQRYWTVYPCGNNVFEVRKGDDSYGVNIDNRTCACKWWDLSDGGDADPSSAGPSVGDLSSAGPSVVDPSSAGPSVGDPSSAGPSVADPSSAGPSVDDPSSAGPSVGGPSSAGPSVGDPSSAGPSVA
nr:hypothetical protein CTI12_AA204890 [Tanacetum cinerariifolium]